MEYLVVGARVLVAVVFAVSAGSKLRSRAAYHAFVVSVIGLRLVPDSGIRAVAPLVVAAEAGVPVLLAIPTTAPAGGMVAVALLTLLTGTVWLAVRRRPGAVCRCFGPGGTPLGYRHVVRNMVLLAVSVLGLAAGGTGSGGAVPLAAAAGLVGALIVIRLDDLLSLFATPTSPTTDRSIT
jgi:hypothetical protein